MPAPRVRRLVGSVLASVLLLGLGSLSARADPTPWGGDGAVYAGGVLCHLADGTRVPMARWQVDGQPTFSTADVVGTPDGDGPAPVDGTLTPMVAGQGGLDSQAIAVLAELIARHGAGPPAETAEVSAAVAIAFGSGGVQSQCLGQAGTSAADLDALRTEAERFAGPYRLTVTAAAAAPPGTRSPVVVTVRSGTGAPVPGIAATVSGAGQAVTGITSSQGSATVSLVVPRAVSTPVTVTASQFTGLLLSAGTPGAVALAPPSQIVAASSLAADLTPHPSIHVDVGGGLVAAHGVVSPIVRVSGTSGLAGTATVTLAGPATPPAGGTCSSLSAAVFAAAPNAWTQTLAVAGDGSAPIGSSPGLAGGCYVAGGTVTIDGVTASAPFEPAAIVDVVRFSVRRSAVPVLTLPGTVATTVTVDAPQDVTATTSATVLGPVAPRDGRCDTVRWTGARVFGPAVARAADGDASSVVLRTPALADVGCYAVQSRTTAVRDGRRLVVQAPAGAQGAVVLVVRPIMTLADDTYDTTQGTPMIGHVSVAGIYRYPATLTVRLRTAAPHVDGCRRVAFAAVAGTASATTNIPGDGTFAFRTPAPSDNTCYAVEASLRMADADIRIAGPAPAASTTFLAGRPPSSPRVPDVVHGRGSTLRAEVVGFVSVLTMLAVAGAVIERGARGRPEPRRRERPA